MKTQFKKADANNSGNLNFDEVKDLCKTLNIKLEKEEMKKLFNEVNTDKSKSRKDRGQVTFTMQGVKSAKVF